jgi:hypothetical protein
VSGEPARTLPAAARRLFPHQPPGSPDLHAHPDFVIERLLEEGDGDDLAWAARQVGEAVLARWLAAHGGRRLSRRSRAFWSLVLGVRPPAPPPAAESLWPR